MSETMSDTTQRFTDQERAALKERASEVKSARRGSRAKVDGAAEVLAKIAGMGEPDRAMAERVHAVVTAAAPELTPKLWYGMPSYAKNGKIVCFFQPAAKFTTRYSTLGFNDAAKLDDDGGMWPVAFALTELTAATEERIADLIRRAAA